MGGVHDDWQLLRAYVETGSPTAFAELVARYADLVYGCGLRQTGDTHAAEDISQVVFMVLARKAKTIRAGTPLGGWLFNVARYTASNYRRVEGRRERREKESAAMKPTASEPPKDSPVAAVLDDAVAALSRKERDAIVLRFYREMNFREVGEALGISEDAAAQRVSRALAHLRERLEKHGAAVDLVGLAALLPIELCRTSPQGFAASIAQAALAPGVNSPLSQIVLRHLAWQKMKLAVALLGTGTAICAAAVGYHVLPVFHQVVPAPPIVKASIARTWTSPRDNIVVSAMTPDGRRALTARGNIFFAANEIAIRLWDVDSGKELMQISGHTGRVTGIAFALNAQRAVSTSLDGTARLWDLGTGQQISQVDAHLPIGCFAISPDGRFAVFGCQRLTGNEYASIADANAPRLRLWDLQSGEDLHQFDDLRQGVSRIAFSPDGKRIGLALDVRESAIWVVGQAQPVARMRVGSAFINSMIFSSDGRRLFAAGDDGELYVWDGFNGVLAARWRLQQGLVHAMAMSSDGRVLYSAGGTLTRSSGTTDWSDCLLHTWDARNGSEIGHFLGHSTGIWGMNLSADGRRMLTTGGQQISVWDIAGE